MSKVAKKVEKGNRNITDFFTRRSSTGTPSTQPTSSQPSSSQPTPSQKLGLRPGLKKKTVLTKTAVVSISSSDSDVAIDKTKHAHISLSSTSNTDDSVVVVAGSSSMSKPRNTTVKKASKPAKKTLAPSQAQSSAKTTVKRRVHSTVTGATPGSSTRPVVRKKRKLDWDDSSDDEMFKPDPSAMKAGLTRAPVPRVPVASAKQKAQAVSSKDAPSSPSGRSTSSKRRRVTSSNARPSARDTPDEEEDVEEVPSTFSDEHELVLPKRKKLNAKEAQETVDRWRRETSVVAAIDEPYPPLTDSPLTSPSERSPSPEPVQIPSGQAAGDDSIMDVDMTDAANLLQGAQVHHDSDVEVSQQLIAEEEESSLSSLSSAVMSDAEDVPSSPRPPKPEPESWAIRPATPPPPAELPPMPPTPVALDVATKTAQTIAKIKAAAEAAAREQQDSSEEQIELGELSDDSDLESLEFKLKPVRKSTPPLKPPGPPSSPLTAMGTSPEPEAGPSTRYNFRRRSSPQDKRRRSTSPDSDVNTSRGPPPPKKSVANPLDKLLREKTNNAKHGKGMEGIRLAEAALHDRDLISKNKGKMREEMDQEEDSDDAMWADEEAAARTACQGAKRHRLSSHDDLENSDSEDEGSNDLDIAEATKHLGDEQGAAVGKILDKDRKGWLRKGQSKKNAEKGLPLWEDPTTDAESTMEQDDGLPSLPIDQEDIKSDRVLTVLQPAVQKPDVTRLSGLLHGRLLSKSKVTYRPQLVSWIFSLQLYKDPTVSERAHEALLSLAACSAVRCSLAASFTSALAQLGAKADILTDCGLKSPPEVNDGSVSSTTRLDILTRMVCVLKTFSQNDAVVPEDGPDLIMALVLVGFDPFTTAELQSEIMVTIDIIGSQMPSSSSGYSDMEPLLCSRLLNFSKEMTPVNKAHLFIFLCGACPQMGRVKRWLAHALLLGMNIVEPAQYTLLPPLEPIVEMLSPMSGSKALFDVVGGAEQDGYFDNLLHYVNILNAALSDVPGYVCEERKTAGFSRTASDRSASPEKAKTELQQIKHSLDVIHGKIVDTRAAHLDRSRAKAAIQQLSFRVHYQREAALKAGRPDRAPGLRAYFPGSKPSS